MGSVSCKNIAGVDYIKNYVSYICNEDHFI